MPRLVLSVCLVLIVVAPLAADEPDKPQPRKLTLSPAKSPTSGLRFRLLPELLEQRPGNAVEHYKCAAGLFKDKIGNFPEAALISLDLPLDRMPKDEIRDLLKKAEPGLAEVEAGTRCESCDWGLTERLRKDAIAARLDGIQEMREAATLLRLRLRLEVADGKLDRALVTARTQLALGRHLADSPTLISLLVGVAVTNQALLGLEEVLQAPGAANLYWSLTELPRPFVDMRKPLQGERLSCYSLYPGLAEVALDLQAGPLTREQLREMTAKYLFFDEALFGGDGRFLNRWLLGLSIARKHEAAKRALIAAGRPRDKVEAMPPLQVAMLHAFDEYDRHLDALVKCQSLPYWEATPAIDKHERAVRQARVDARDPTSNAPALPIAPLLLPAVSKVMRGQVRLERRLAALRIIEAVRLYAADHDGKLPPSLADIKDVPVPVNPATGKPFHYAVKDGVVTLSAPDLPGDTPTARLHYELTLRK